MRGDDVGSVAGWRVVIQRGGARRGEIVARMGIIRWRQRSLHGGDNKGEGGGRRGLRGWEAEEMPRWVQLQDRDDEH